MHSETEFIPELTRILQETFKKYVMQQIPSVDHLVCMGDVNIDLLDVTGSAAKKLNGLLNNFGKL